MDKQNASRIFKALSDPTRLKIVECLREGEICACWFTQCTGKAQPTVSQHLRILENAGIIGFRKERKSILYRLKDRKILKLIQIAKEVQK